jgi:HNH endonuclease
MINWPAKADALGLDGLSASSPRPLGGYDFPELTAWVVQREGYPSWPICLRASCRDRQDLHPCCGQRFPEDLIVRRRPCLRVYERERSRARRQRASAQQRTLAVSASAAGAAGSFDQLEVHHEVPIAKGGRPDVLDNLVTLCVACHRRRRQGDGSRSWLGPSHTPSAGTSRETPQPRRASRGTSSARHDCDRVVG